MQPALKPTSFDDRMEKTTKAQAIKKLQVELKEEKQAEIQR
jgi:rRNA-processing protein CGR1